MEGPMLIDWERVHLDGMKGFEVAIRRLEAEVCAQAADLTELRGALRPGQRMEVVWFQRYAALMLALLDVGLPELKIKSYRKRLVRKRLLLPAITI